MLLLGGLQTVMGPLVGAAVLHTLKDQIMPLTELWRMTLGLSIIAMVLLFPSGLVGAFEVLREHFSKRGPSPSPHAEVRAEGEPRSTHGARGDPSRLAEPVLGPAEGRTRGLAPQDEAEGPPGRGSA